LRQNVQPDLSRRMISTISPFFTLIWDLAVSPSKLSLQAAKGDELSVAY